MLKLLTIILLGLSIASCQSEHQTDKNELPDEYSRKLSEIKETALPELVQLEKLKQTMFAPTLENPIEDKQNVVHAPTLLFAWNKIEEILRSGAVLNETNSKDFQLLAKSDSHRQSMNPDEYTLEADTDGESIIARAFFHKSLPFKIEFHTLGEPILFDKTKVAAFGLKWQDFDVIAATQILYYKDDQHVILKLLPKDRQHEIILAMGLDKYASLAEALRLLNESIEKGKQERKDTKQAWKYVLNEEDRFAIPIVKFHIETNYNTLEGQRFYTKDGIPHFIKEAYQRTGFVLDQNGAVIESDVSVSADSMGMELPHPKKMVYNKPFLIAVKRADKTNPYFVMKVSNAELMMKK